MNDLKIQDGQIELSPPQVLKLLSNNVMEQFYKNGMNGKTKNRIIETYQYADGTIIEIKFIPSQILKNNVVI